jgi:hypothetical protein
MDPKLNRPLNALSLSLAAATAWLTLPSVAMAHSAPAEGAPPPPAGAQAGSPAEAWFQNFISGDGLDTLVHVLGAILLFIVGWIVAKLLSYATMQLLGRTSVDNKIANKLGITMLLKDGRDTEQAVEKFIAAIVYWTAMLLVVIGVLEYAGLEKVADPIEGLVAEVTGALPNIGKAILIVVVAYFAGTILKIGVTRVLERVSVDKRFAELTDSKKGDTAPFSEAAGRVLFWLIMVVGIAGAFESLEIGPIADPMRNAIDEIVGILPRLATAILLLIVGWVGGRIVRALVRNVLKGLGFDGLVARVDLDRFMGKTTASDVIGIVAMVFVILQATIAALNEMGLETLSDPLTEMMSQFWNLLPALAISIVIIAAGVFVGQLLRGVVSGALHSIGLDRFMERMGFKKLSEQDDRLKEYSELVGYAVQVGVILLAVAQALDNLMLDTWAGYVNAFLGYVITRIAVAVLIVGVGMAIGNYVRDLVKARAEDEAQGWVAEFARYAVLVFAFTMAVQQLDVAEDFVLMTFGLLFGGLCLGAALAFGLGGRELASTILKKRYDEANRPSPRGARSETPTQPVIRQPSVPPKTPEGES